MGSHQLRDASKGTVVINSQPPVIRLHHSKILAFFRAFDSVLIIATLWGSLWVWTAEWTNSYAVLGIFAVVLFGFFAESNEVYSLWDGVSSDKLALRLMGAWGGTCLAVIIAAMLIDSFKNLSLKSVLLWSVATPVVMISLHWARRGLLAHLRAKPAQPGNVAVVGATDLGVRLVKSMKGMPWLGYRVLGYYDDREVSDDLSRRTISNDVNVCGGMEQLYADARDGKVDTVFITLPMRAEQRIQSLIIRLADTTVSAYLIPDVFNFDLLHSRLTGIQGIPALSIYDSPLVDNGWSKRIEDILVGGCILALISIPMMFIAVAVKMTSPGPVFFKQTRYGMRGEKIKVWKFRSMTVCEDGDDVPQARREDPRITPLGAFLRRTSLDELPQFFNVIEGSMSIVGPRPHAVSHNEYYRGQIKGYMLRHKVKPGITGLAQVNGFRGETDTLDKMSGRIAYDLEYIRSWSLVLDLMIIWRTLFKGFAGRHVY